MSVEYGSGGSKRPRWSYKYMVKSNVSRSKKKPSLDRVCTAWIIILQLLASMTTEERQKCIRATVEFYKER